MKKKVPILILLIVFIVLIKFIQIKVMASGEIKLNINGKNIDSSIAPFIENGRTLVPIRIIGEELGAEVIWNEENRTVEIIKENNSILLRIDSRLVECIGKDKKYFLSDIGPKIVNGSTFVPIRLVSNGLGIGIHWDDKSRTVYIDSKETSEFIPFYNVEIISSNNGQTIKGRSELQIRLASEIENAKEIKFLLLDPKTAEGFVIGRGEEITGKYSWLPSLKDKGEKVLVAAIYDENGNFLAGDSILINIDIEPSINLTGIENQIIDGPISIGADINFEAFYVKYEITNLDKNKTTITDKMDPYGSYKWTPMWEDNGNYVLKVIAYDYDEQAYESEPIDAKVEISKNLSLLGVKEGMTIDRPVTLSASRNFQVSETEYVMRDAITGEETILAKVGYQSYKWFPGPDISGTKELFIRVKDTRLRTIESQSITVNLEGAPVLILDGIGPNQVVTGDVKLKVISNIDLDKVEYIITNLETGYRKILTSNEEVYEVIFSPSKEDKGLWKIQAIGKYGQEEIKSEEIPVKIYLDETYSPLPIIEKDKFLDLASDLAKDSWEKTGMSAALQTAQAILETGWGQSVPVDKYTGQLSNNLFGIKGKGTAGSVISNTWEEYNGNRFRIDAEFRAYNNIHESWTDHKNLLLTSSRYEPFREVMHNRNQGAWALKRTGYATDSQYPLKLMEIIRLHNLQELDKVGI